jgi:NAD(P)-dependent dehydrogenase (short-subunit alcohol dehydrogenase family)
MKKLENKVAVITGGNSGIGLATAILFADEDAKVAITGRDPQTLASAIIEIGHGAIGLVSDATNISQLDKHYKSIYQSFGNIDILVINAGVYVGGPLISFTEEMFDQNSDTNFKGVFFAVQKALPYLNDGASIILTSSALTTMGMPTTAAYSASKAAVNILAKSFSNELADRNIRVNVLSPGPIDTPIIGRGGVTPERLTAMKTGRAARTVAGRLGTAEEIAEGFLYLASDASRFIIGSELLIDGGMRLK